MRRSSPEHGYVPAMGIKLVSVAFALALVAGGCASDGEQAAPDVDLAPAPETAAHADQWPAPGRDLANSRAVVDSPITAATIDQLEEAWQVPLPGPGIFGNAASGPVVIDDTVVVQDLSSTVRAIDLETGEVRWTRTYDLLTIGPNGPAVGYGQVYVAKGTTEIAALDLDDGTEVWSTKITRTDTEGVDIQPQVYGGLVYASSVPISLQGQYTGGDRGVLHALDAETGEVRWTFDTVDSEDLWGDPDVNSGGGAWYPPAIDEASGTVVWGVANPAPFPGTPEAPNGSSRPGPNLYTNSVVVLDAATGELQWYHQAIEHDLFDRDLVHTMVVTTDDGPVIVGTGKLGRVIGLDPQTGEERWDTEIGDHENDDLTELDGPTTVLPGTYGGVLTPPAWADGVVYAAVVNAPNELSPDVPSYLGAELGQMPGTMVAVDAADGELLWSVDIDGDPLGGTTVVGDVVLTGTMEGLLLAFDRASGAEVWRLQAPGGLNGWPAVVDDTVLWPVGMADPPALVAYRLGG
jgi:outer membrane protein assembly factor BamB